MKVRIAGYVAAGAIALAGSRRMTEVENHEGS
jgi:hypothetical protein